MQNVNAVTLTPSVKKALVGHAQIAQELLEPKSRKLFVFTYRLILCVTLTGSISGDGGGTSLPHQDSSATNADDIFRGKIPL